MRIQHISFFAGLISLAIMLQGCPKEPASVPCYLNNIVVRNGLNVSPAADSIRFGDTLWIAASVYRHVRDNGNQPIDLNGKELNTRLTFTKMNMASGEVLQASDFKLVLLTGSQGASDMSTNRAYTARLNYQLVGDSMKLLAGFVPQRKGIYSLTGKAVYISFGSPSLWFGTEFYKNGSCYQGLLNDSFTTPNRHWHFYYNAPTTYNSPVAYYVNFY